MEGDPAVFGFPSIWTEVYSVHRNTFRSIERVMDVARAVIDGARECATDHQRLFEAFAQVNLGSMADVLILVGNKRGAGAMKIARSMFEVSIVAEYLEANRALVQDYLDFAIVLGWRWLQNVPGGKLAVNQGLEVDREYDRVRARFMGSTGRVRSTWSTKSLKEMAAALGRSDLYEVVYRAASALQHVDALGLIGHDLDWGAEALRVGHGSLLQTVCTLHSASDRSGGSEGLSAATADFEEVWKIHAAGRREGRSPGEVPGPLL